LIASKDGASGETGNKETSSGARNDPGASMRAKQAQSSKVSSLKSRTSVQR
jgi:hypothetical protein